MNPKNLVKKETTIRKIKIKGNHTKKKKNQRDELCLKYFIKIKDNIVISSGKQSPYVT